MEYKILTQKVSNALIRNLDKATDDLARKVNQQIALGWEPHGGVAIGEIGMGPCLFQAMTKSR